MFVNTVLIIIIGTLLKYLIKLIVLESLSYNIQISVAIKLKGINSFESIVEVDKKLRNGPLEELKSRPPNFHSKCYGTYLR